MASTEERLELLEQRMASLERLLQAGHFATTVNPTSALSATTKAPPATTPGAPAINPAATPKFDRERALRRPVPATPPVSVTQILGWTGATAIVLAAIFLIRLALDAGWLTPERQIGLAVLGSFALVGLGLRFRSVDVQYASFLPAAGVVVQFCAVYGAHLYYHLIAANAATVAVILICLFTLWLGRKFDNQVYALFAVIGSYSAPFFISLLLLLSYFFRIWLK